MPAPSIASRIAAKRTAATKFVERWKDRGREVSDTQAFWLDLCQSVLNMPQPATQLQFENPTVDGGRIDVRIDAAKTFIEQKSVGIDLDKPEPRQGLLVTPFEQALRYANSQTNLNRPDTIITCNFSTFRIHSLNDPNPSTNYIEFQLSELPEQFHLLDFLSDPNATRTRREEKVSIQAGELIGRLYDLLLAQYAVPDSSLTQHSLNVLSVRLVFCLFAEDAGIFEKNALHAYLKDVPAREIRHALQRLFTILNTPLSDRNSYDRKEFAAFPYVNGGLFADDSIEIPPFTEEIKTVLLDDVSLQTDWSQISPTVFGGVFESTLNPDTRHSGGMHYTSVKNIHRTIGPLFLDDLTDELNKILTSDEYTPRRRKNALTTYVKKLSTLNFLDPACGSGNFLTETYICLRRLEKIAITELSNNQSMMAFGDEAMTPLQVSLQQFHGIEINDFACSVATTALWIAKLQADLEIESLIAGLTTPLPLTDKGNIHCNNALTTNWEDVLPTDKCSYIIGNPPFLGARKRTKEQLADLKLAFQAIGVPSKVGELDYVCGWYGKAAGYMADNPIKCAFVSTNSICQGEQVGPLWKPLYDLGFEIDFAHDTFKWSNDAQTQAAVQCVIVGFSKHGKRNRRPELKRLYHYTDIDGEPELQEVSELNPNLNPLPPIFLETIPKPLCDVPLLGIGNKPVDGGNYLFKTPQKEEFLAKEPLAARFFHRWYGASEFIHGKERWILWLGDTPLHELDNLPLCRERVQKVIAKRLESPSAQTRELAETPTNFHVENIPNTPALLVPRVSSKNRAYIPMGFIGANDFASDSALIAPEATMFHFGIMTSKLHYNWMKSISGRLKSDFRYSAGVTYNNFPWPETTKAQKDRIAHLAQAVLEARDLYPDHTLEKLYHVNNSWMYPELFAAHSALDNAVNELYGIPPEATELESVAIIYKMYNEIMAQKS